MSENKCYLFKGPFIMSVFGVSVDEGIQSLRDDSAMVRKKIRVKLSLIINKRDDSSLEKQKASHFVVSTGLGSKFPSASTDAFFSVLEE